MSEEAAQIWTIESEGLIITLPETSEEQHAYALQSSIADEPSTQQTHV